MSQSKVFGGVIIVVVLALVGYVGYFKIDWNKSGSTDAPLADAGQSREILTYVPADTLFFIGGLEPIPFQHAIDMIAPGSGWLKHADWSKQLTDDDKAKMPPAGLMLTSLVS